MAKTNFACAAAIFAIAASAAVPAAATSADRMNLVYQVYSGGFHILNFELELALAPERYDVTTRMRSAGFVGWFMSWKQDAGSQGLFGQDGVSPIRHRSEGEFRGRRRSVEIDYDAGKVNAVRLDPPPQDDEGREEVSVERRREAMDPISAILSAIRRISAGQGCGGRLPVFDGRRRYDLVLTDRASHPTGAPQLAGAPGGRVQCDFVYDRIAGHERSQPSDPETKNKRRIQSGRVFAERNGTLIVPVRIEIDGDWGMTIAHLREVKRDAD
jgi:hypothetical protein